jgi:hypothetical protein
LDCFRVNASLVCDHLRNDKIILEVREKESFELHMTEVTMTFIKKESNLYNNSVSFTDWTRSQLTENILLY